MKRYVLVFASVLRTHSIGLKLTKKVGSIISTKVVEVLKTGVKVAVDPEQKIVVMIKKNQLAIEPADCRPEIYSVGNTMADALIEELDFESRKIVLSPKAAQKREQDPD